MLDFCEQSKSASEFCPISDLERNEGNSRHVALQLQTSWFCWGLDEIGDESCGSVDVEFELFLGEVGDLHMFCIVVSSSRCMTIDDHVILQDFSHVFKASTTAWPSATMWALYVADQDRQDLCLRGEICRCVGFFSQGFSILHRVMYEDTWDSSLCIFCCFWGREFSHSSDSCILWRSSLSQSHCMLDVAILRRRRLSWLRALTMRFRGGWAGKVKKLWLQTAGIEYFEPLFFSALHFSLTFNHRDCFQRLLWQCQTEESGKDRW